MFALQDLEGIQWYSGRVQVTFALHWTRICTLRNDRICGIVKLPLWCWAGGRKNGVRISIAIWHVYCPVSVTRQYREPIRSGKICHKTHGRSNTKLIYNSINWAQLPAIPLWISFVENNTELMESQSSLIRLLVSVPAVWSRIVDSVSVSSSDFVSTQGNWRVFNILKWFWLSSASGEAFWK